MGLVQRLIPSPTQEEYDLALAGAQAYLHSVGVTAWQDAILGGYAGVDDPSPTYLRAMSAGRLSARVRGALWWDRSAGLEQLEHLLERRTELTRGRLDAGSVKIMQDGVAENYTAAMTSPYRDGCGGHTHNHGLSFVDPTVLNEAVTRLDAHGFQVHVHAIGDAPCGRRSTHSSSRDLPTEHRADGTTSRTSRSSAPRTGRGSPSSTSLRTCSRCGRSTTTR